MKLGKTILQEDDLKHEVTVYDTRFVLRIPTPEERNGIEIAIARRLGGQPRDCFSQAHQLDVQIRVTLEAIIVDCSDPDFDVWKTLDNEMVYKVYTEFQDFNGRLLKRIER